MKPPSSRVAGYRYGQRSIYLLVYQRRTFMGEFVKQVERQATEALREILGYSPLPQENPLLELMGLLLGDGFGEVQSPPAVPITSQQWLDWHHLALTNPQGLMAAMNCVLETEQRKLPREPEAMRLWATSLMLGTLDQLEMM
jgi:hypothetical protein